MTGILRSRIRLFQSVIFGLGLLQAVLFLGLLSLLTQEAKVAGRYNAAQHDRASALSLADLAVSTAVERDLVKRADMMHELEAGLDTYRLTQQLDQYELELDLAPPGRIEELARALSESTRSEVVLLLVGAIKSHLSDELIPPIQTVITSDEARLNRLNQLVFWSNMLLLIMVALSMSLMIRYMFKPLAVAAVTNEQQLTMARGELEQLEFCDVITGLPSRRGLDRFLKELKPLMADEGAHAALVIKLEPVARTQRMLSDTITDGIAQELANRLAKLKSEIRYLAHCGQGRFFVLCEYGAPVDNQPRILDRIEQLLFEQIVVHDSRIAVDLMAGYRPVLPGEAAETIYKEADIALGIALASGSENRVRYTEDIRSKIDASSELGAELSSGLSNDELQAYYQPQINLRTGTVTGFEALVRWNHPTRGLMPPGMFLPLIEELGLDDALGEVMLNQGLQALKDWDAGGVEGLQIGLNFSQAQLRDPMLVETLRWEIDRFDVPPERVTVEVLENIYVENDEDRIVANIRALSNLGLKIDLDDFGTGTASITGLRRFRANRIKIDRSYVSDLDKNIDNQKLVSTMINMAQSMEIETLAEGVETEEEMAFLLSLGCQGVQGYAIAKPMPFDETMTWLAEYNARLEERRRGSAAVAV